MENFSPKITASGIRERILDMLWVGSSDLNFNKVETLLV
jgi:hypothetical protein